MAQISFSIVVVCLNPGEKLLKTVQSVLNQKYGNYEIVVKDGGSTDGSLYFFSWAITSVAEVLYFRHSFRQLEFQS